VGRLDRGAVVTGGQRLGMAAGVRTLRLPTTCQLVQMQLLLRTNTKEELASLCSSLSLYFPPLYYDFM